jgi:hypothetical protein
VFKLAATKKPKTALHEVGDLILALHCGRWLKATVETLQSGRWSKYLVKGDDKITWQVTKDDIRELPLNILDVKVLETADDERIIRAVRTRAKRWEKKMQQLQQQQLKSLLQCLNPTRYKYSQHYQSLGYTGGYDAYTTERSKKGLPDLDGTLVYVGEQNFFGTNMLGAFSAADWGMPLDKDVTQKQKTALNKMCRTEFSFGRSCFVVDVANMVREVLRLTQNI